MWSHWLKFVCAHCRPRATAFESSRLDHIQTHRKKKHPSQPKPSLPSARAIAAGTVQITDEWCAIACGICARCFEATSGDVVTMLKAQKDLIAHIKRHHPDIGECTWHVRPAVNGLLQREDVAPSWTRLLKRYGCEDIGNIIAGVAEVDYVEWWYDRLRYPTSDAWLEQNLPHLLYAGVVSRYPELAMRIDLPDFIDMPDAGVAGQSDPTSGATVTYHEDTTAAAAGPDTVTTPCHTERSTEIAMDMETAPTTADWSDARDMGLEHRSSQAWNALENEAYPFAEPGNGPLLNSVGSGPALAEPTQDLHIAQRW